MSRRDLMRREVPEVTATSHPASAAARGQRAAAGVRLRARQCARRHHSDVARSRCSRPRRPPISRGRFRAGAIETITELLRALPKQIRKAFVPVPEHAARAAAEIDVDHKEFHAALAEWITRSSGVPMTVEEVAALPITDALRFNIRVVDLDGAVLAEGRDLLALKRGVRRVESRAIGRPCRTPCIAAGISAKCPRSRVVQRRGLRFTVYPTLRDHGDGVELAEAGSRPTRRSRCARPILRLAMLASAGAVQVRPQAIRRRPRHRAARPGIRTP